MPRARVAGKKKAQRGPGGGQAVVFTPARLPGSPSQSCLPCLPSLPWRPPECLSHPASRLPCPALLS